MQNDVRSVVLGPRVLGKEGFAAQKLKLSKRAGATGLGKTHDKPFVPRVAAAPGQLPRAVMPPTPPVAPPTPPAPPAKANVAGKASVPGKRAKAERRGKNKPAAAAPIALSFSEAEAEAMLEQDPNSWSKIVDAETKRAEGPRRRIAELVIAAAPKATAVPVPPEVLAALEAMLKAAE